jgi:phosphonate transport system substrate-binding protein
MRPATGYLTVTLLLLVWLSVRPLLHGENPLGSESNPIRIMLTPSTDAQAIIRDGEVLAEYITRRTGLHVKVAVPNFYITVVEAFGTNRADMAIMNTFSYLLAHKKYGANAVMRVARRYGELSYRGEFIVHAESGITTIEQLRGKTIAYVDPSSTSGYIYPKDMLRKRGVSPRQEMFAYGHNQVVTKVYTRDVDAGAVFYSRPDTVTGEQLDARTKIKTEHPDVFQKVRVIGLTEEIPNDPVVARKGLDKAIVSRICDALLSFQRTESGKKALMTIASVEGFQRTSDAAYDDVRKLVASYGVDVEQQLRKTKK